MSESQFVALQNDLFTHVGQGKYDDAHLIIDTVQRAFPQRKEKTYFWRTCVYALQNKIDEAMTVLRDALQEGIWWNPQRLIQDPDLTILQTNDHFKKIVDECQRILDQANNESTSKLFTYGKNTSEIGLFTLHWRGSNVNDFAPYFFSDDLLNKYHFGFPQSSQVFEYNAYCWDDPSIAMKDVHETFKTFNENSKDVIIAGASQGGKLAMELSLSNQVMDTKGFIAVIPAIQQLESFKKMLQNNDHIRGCIITGDQDPFYEKTMELVALFEERNFPYKLIVNEGLGHFFPENFTDQLEEAIEFIVS